MAEKEEEERQEDGQEEEEEEEEEEVLRAEMTPEPRGVTLEPGTWDAKRASLA